MAKIKDIKSGDEVTVTLTGIASRDGGNVCYVSTPARGSVPGPCVYLAPGDEDSVTLEIKERVPDNWPPRPGDVWVNKSNKAYIIRMNLDDSSKVVFVSVLDGVGHLFEDFAKKPSDWTLLNRISDRYVKS